MNMKVVLDRLTPNNVVELVLGNMVLRGCKKGIEMKYGPMICFEKKAVLRLHMFALNSFLFFRFGNCKGTFLKDVRFVCCFFVWVRLESNVWCFWVFQRKLPSTMPTQFNATYTPIGSGSSEGIMKHLARLMAVQMVAAGVGPGVLEVNRRRQVRGRRTFSLRLYCAFFTPCLRMNIRPSN